MDVRLLDVAKITFLSDTCCIVYENLTIYCFNDTILLVCLYMRIEKFILLKQEYHIGETRLSLGCK